MEIDDKTLIAHILSGQSEDFRHLMRRHGGTLLAFIESVIGNREEAEDIVNETYLKFLRSLPTVDPKKNVMAYLTAISRNESLNALAKRQKVGELEEEDSRLLCYDDYLSEFSLFDRAKDVLPRDEFEILLMVMVDDLKHREIAKILHKPLGTVSFKYAKAIKTLRKELSHERL